MILVAKRWGDLKQHPQAAPGSMEHESKENGPRIHQQRVAEIQGAILYGPDGKSVVDVIDNLFRNDGWRDEHPVNYLTISSPSHEEASEIQQVLKEHDTSFIGFYSGVDMGRLQKKQRAGLDRGLCPLR
jgi:hypothetical protein